MKAVATRAEMLVPSAKSVPTNIKNNQMKLIYPETYVVWDLETTGLNPKTDRIVEFAALMIDSGSVAESYSAILNWNIDIPEEAARIHGITKERAAAEGQPPVEVLQRMLEIFRRNRNFVTHNGLRFDVPFVIEAFLQSNLLTVGELEELRKRLLTGMIDTAAWFKGDALDMGRMWNESFATYGMRVLETIAPGVKYNVAFCCDKLGIDRSGAQQHRAGGDIQLTNEIYKKLVLA